MKTFLRTFAATCCLFGATFLTPKTADAQLSLEIDSIQDWRNPDGSIEYTIDLEVAPTNGGTYYLPTAAAEWDAPLNREAGFQFVFSDADGFGLSGLDHHVNITTQTSTETNNMGHDFFVISDDEIFTLSIFVYCQGNETFPNHRVRLSKINYFGQLNGGTMGTRSLTPPSQYTSDTALTCVPAQPLSISNVDIESRRKDVTIPSVASHPAGVKVISGQFDIDRDMSDVAILIKKAGSQLLEWGGHVNNVSISAQVSRNGVLNDLGTETASGFGVVPIMDLGILLKDDRVEFQVKTELAGCLDDLKENDSLSFSVELIGIESSDPGMIRRNSLGTGDWLNPLIPTNGHGLDIGPAYFNGTDEQIIVSYSLQKEENDILSRSLRFWLTDPVGRRYLTALWVSDAGFASDLQISNSQFHINTSDILQSLGLTTLEEGIWSVEARMYSQTHCEHGVDSTIFEVELPETPTGIRDISESQVEVNRVGDRVTFSNDEGLEVFQTDTWGRLTQKKGNSIEFVLPEGASFFSVIDGGKKFSTKIINVGQ